MLVDVVCMRKRGEKIDRDLLRQVAPVRGQLGLSAIRAGWYAGKRNAPLMAWLIHPERMDHLLPPLDPARVTVIDVRGMVILGVEEISGTFKRQIRTYPQAWWVRPAAGPMPKSEPEVRRPHPHQSAVPVG